MTKDNICVCGQHFTLAAHLARHQTACLGENPTHEDLLRVGKATITEQECWEWNGKRHQHNYGLLAPATARLVGEWRVHRYSLILAGISVDNLFVLHECDNPPCFNPKHLRVGTQKDNMRDARDKGRMRGWFDPKPADIRTCPVCGVIYEQHPPGKRKDTCSRRCAGILGYQNRELRNTRLPESSEPWG